MLDTSAAAASSVRLDELQGTVERLVDPSVSGTGSLLSSKGNGNRVDLHEMLLIIMRTREFAVLLEFNILRCEDNSVSISFRKTLVRAAV